MTIDSAGRSAVTDLLLRVMVHGVVDREVLLGWTDIAVDDRLVADLVAQDALAADDGLVYVTKHGDQLLTSGLRVDPKHEDALVAFFDEFTALDIEVKAVLTDWQRAQREDDPEGRLVAVERWLDVDQRLHHAAGRQDGVRGVLGCYLDRLQAARQTVLDGETDQLSGAGDSSYHSIWFLLHEVLIRSLGRSRRATS